MIEKCLFPVAGYGTRFLPATKSMPKEMLPIVDKPLIQYAAEEAMEAGMVDLGFVTGRTKRAIEDHFDINYELENEIDGSGKESALDSIREVMQRCRFSYTRQTSMLGLGHAVHTGETLVGRHPFGVMLADDFCINPDGAGVMAQMVELYRQYQCSIVAVMDVPDEHIHKYGVVAGEVINDSLMRVHDMVEKPTAEDAPSNLAVIGRYILTPDIFDILESTAPGKGGEIQVTDAICEQAKQGNVIAYKFKGLRFDCGSVDGFVDATNYIYNTMNKN